MSGESRHLHAVHAAPALDDFDDCAILVDGDELFLLAPGEYLGACVASRRRTAYGRAALVLTFDVVSTATGAPMPEATRLSMWCRLGPGGRIPRMSKWARTWKLAAGRPLRRGERMRPRVLHGLLLRLLVHTVTVDAQQRPLASVNQYSVVDQVLSVETGGPRA